MARKMVYEGQCDQCGGAKPKRNHRFCCMDCKREYKRLHPDPNPSKGVKQSKETIEKRIRNTDQKKKQETRRNTLRERYGVDNWSQTDEGRAMLSEAHTGRKILRTEEHQRKIIESKRENGTLAHTQETKDKISKKLREVFRDPDFDKTVFIKDNPANWVNGYFEGMHYRSSYEKLFLEFCREYRVTLASAESKDFEVKYVDSEGVTRSYFPDFYLPDFNIVVEIKPDSMYDVGNNLLKFDAACITHENFMVITESDGLTDEKEWPELYSVLIETQGE